ncbi:hydroxymethylbilane synthase [Natronorarus salvus]|uniref:hydroxymethylbilane synthase n=1 Tax=Natronorarus salvus TaxID=3117733 RepID=UPI002F26DC56
MTRRPRSIRLATRGSDLALAQARTVERALSGRRYDVEVVTVETEGDRITDELIHRLGTTGAFVRALDERVLEGDADAAIHSMKDVPTEMPDELVVAGVPERGSREDLLVTPQGRTLSELPEGATVGTASLRRGAQLLAARPDLVVEPVRGNVDTRIEKLLAPWMDAEHERRREDEAERRANTGNEEFEPAFDRRLEEWHEGLSPLRRAALDRDVEVEYDALILARAGLERAELLGEVGVQSLTVPEFVPAPGQGALCVIALEGEVAETIHDRIDHPRSRVETTVERTVLAALGGGCVAPLGISARVQGSYVATRVQALSRDGTERIGATRDLPIESHASAARRLADELADRGARELIEAARREDVGGTDG